MTSIFAFECVKIQSQAKNILKTKVKQNKIPTINYRITAILFFKLLIL